MEVILESFALVESTPVLSASTIIDLNLIILNFFSLAPIRGAI
jgi:hypothetical protein